MNAITVVGLFITGAGLISIAGILLFVKMANFFPNRALKAEYGFVPTPESLEAGDPQPFVKKTFTEIKARMTEERAEVQRKAASQRETTARHEADGKMPGLCIAEDPFRIIVTKTTQAGSGEPTVPSIVEEHLLSAATAAELHESGSVAAVRGRNLAAKGVGGLLLSPALGPLGLLFVGNAKTQVIDQRSWYLTLSDPAWNLGVVIDAAYVNHARNLVARLTAAANSLAVVPTQSVDRIGQLERLSALHASGALNDEEFASEKERALGHDA